MDEIDAHHLISVWIGARHQLSKSPMKLHDNQTVVPPQASTSMNQTTQAD